MRYAILLSALLLSGCWETIPKVVVPDGSILVKKVRIDPKLLQDCQKELAELKGLSPSDALQALAESQNIHNACWANNHELIGVLKTAFPLEGPSDAASSGSK